MTAAASRARGRGRTWLRSALFGLLAVGCGCGDGGRGAAPPRSGAPLPPGVRVEVPIGAPAVRAVHALPRPKALADPNLTLVSPVIALESDRAAFGTPVTVTLPLDGGAVDPGNAPLTAVLTLGSLCEILDVEVTRAGDGASASFALFRTLPLVAASGADPQEGIEPGVAVATRRGILRRVSAFDGPNREAWVWSEHELFAKVEGPSLVRLLDEAEANLEKAGFPRPSHYQLEFTPLGTEPEAPWGMAHGSGRMQINADRMTHAGAEIEGTMIHEYAHLVQHAWIEAQARDSGVQVPRESAWRIAWLDEATAEFVAGRAHAGYRSVMSSALQPSLAYRPLVGWEDIRSLLHGRPVQYQSAAFFHFLDRDFDGLAVVRDTYLGLLKPSAEPLDALDAALRKQKERSGATTQRTLRSLFGEYLLHLYWFRDFDPVRTLVHDEWDAPRGALVLPRSSGAEGPSETWFVPWTLPEEEGNRRTLERERTIRRDEGGPMQIARGFWIRSGVMKTDLATDLVISVKAPTAAEDLFLVAFPTEGEKLLSPVLGQGSLRISGWHEKRSAYVWLGDASRAGVSVGAVVTARVEPQEQELRWKVDLERTLRSVRRDLASSGQAPEAIEPMLLMIAGMMRDLVLVIASDGRWRVASFGDGTPVAAGTWTRDGEIYRMEVLVKDGEDLPEKDRGKATFGVESGGWAYRDSSAKEAMWFLPREEGRN